ncbi:MAG: hypothetical protein J6V72_04425 [Kiritimatiellae bacterium]|nr:hypothetical protein [Kiritimatiellia bacterium]
MPRPEDWLASTTTAFNGTLEIEGEGLGRLDDGRLVKDVVGTLPILVKLLDSDERLVIQAHPTVPCAKRLFNSPVGKTECWYFLPGTAPDACVYLGFKPGITRAAWEEAVRAGLEPTANGRNVEKSKCRSACRTSHVACPNPATDAQERVPPAATKAGAINCAPPAMLSYLHRIPVKAGDFVFVDGGMPHAIGGGCFMIELQEPSDLMVVAERVTPSGRRIPDAKMHGGVGWEKMFDVYEYEGRTFEETCARYVRRAGGAGAINCAPPVRQILGSELTDKFSMWRVTDGGRVALPRDRAVAVVTEGAGEVNGLVVKKGDRLVVADERQLTVSGTATLVVCA